MAAVRSDPDVLGVRRLLAREAHRFPELHDAWQQRSPTLHHPAAAAALNELVAAGRLDIPDVETAVVQLYALLVFPHMVFGDHGTGVDDTLTERLITVGVDMFLTYYAPRA